MLPHSTRQPHFRVIFGFVRFCGSSGWWRWAGALPICGGWNGGHYLRPLLLTQIKLCRLMIRHVITTRCSLF